MLLHQPINKEQTMLRQSKQAQEAFYNYTRNTMSSTYKKSPVMNFVTGWVGVIENGEPVIYVKAYERFPKEIDGVKVRQYDFVEMPKQDWEQAPI
jgi:hypothetical protein